MRKPSVFYTFPYGITSLVKVRLFSWKLVPIIIFLTFVALLFDYLLLFIDNQFGVFFRPTNSFIYPPLDSFFYAISKSFLVFTILSAHAHYIENSLRSNTDLQDFRVLPNFKSMSYWLVSRSFLVPLLLLFLQSKFQHSIFVFTYSFKPSTSLYSLYISTGIKRLFEGYQTFFYYIDLSSRTIWEILLLIISISLFIALRESKIGHFKSFITLTAYFYMIGFLTLSSISLGFASNEKYFFLRLIQIAILLPFAYIAVRHRINKINGTFK